MQTLWILIVLIVFAGVFLYANRDKRPAFDRGYEWARQEHMNGKTISQLRRYTNSTLDYNDFDRGAEAYMDKIDGQIS